MNTILCENPRCKWFNTTWVIQVHRDGTVQPPTDRHDKSFPAVPDRTEAYEQYYNNLLQQTEEGGEVRN